MLKQQLQKPEIFLYLFAAAVPISFAAWQALINNFSIEQAGFTGIEIGILQSLREVPGFLAFAVVFLLLVMREQTIAFVSLLALGIGTAITGMLPSVIGLYFTTVLMSVGFHYAETIMQSLSLQLISAQRLPLVLGRILAVGSFVGLAVFALLFVMVEWLKLSYLWIYLLFGIGTLLIAALMYFGCPHFKGEADQHKTMVLRRRYWLYYLLTFLSGARRQIFVVFAGFLMVEKFGFTVAQMSLLFLVNGVLTIYLAPRIGRLVSYWGEKRTLSLEYGGLVCIFTAYAFAESAWFASALYILDHVFFAMAIALKSYLKKIADPADMASTAGVSFSINHIAAVVLPFVLGLVWVASPPLVFIIGALIALASLLLSQLVPGTPDRGIETVFSHGRSVV
ncbi:MAG: MFS transporter [Gammaproteobacteria bacterium]|nr:MAG: MFS transporter [Gammaproteobacteria bacterium]UCH38558.1 MAG: MFS transporter [Gammaproteobacteria bacterium]